MKNILNIFGFFLFLLSIAQPLFSHGTVIYPQSRIYSCFSNPSNPVCTPCGNAIYDWMGVLQPDTNFGNHQALIPDGQIASGGNANFSCLDALTAAWPATPVDHGFIDVKWENTAPHKTQYYKVYITQLNWDPTKPLRWNDLIEIGHVGPSPPESFTTIRSFIPDSYAGKRAALVSIWQRDYNDSHEAFYSVSDILVNPKDGTCTTGDEVSITFDNNTNCTLQYYQNTSLQGSANAGDSFATNTTVGSQWTTKDTLGNQVDSFTITCDQAIYTSTAECSNVGGCGGLNTWLSDAIYVTGDKVAYNDIEYEAKWWNTKKDPEQNSGQWEVWKNLGPCTTSSNVDNKAHASEAPSFTVYPNPAKDIINLRIHNLTSLSSKISIKNIDGKTLETQILKTPKGKTKANQTIKLNDLSPGIYFIQITTENKTQTQKIFVQ